VKRDLHELANREGFAAAISALSKQIGADVVVPPADADCRALIPVRERLEPAALAAPSLDAYERASHKGELAPSVGLAVAEGDEVAGVEEAVAVGRSLGWPVVIRPVESVAVEPDGGLRKRGVVRAVGEDELRTTWDATVGAGQLPKRAKKSAKWKPRPPQSFFGPPPDCRCMNLGCLQTPACLRSAEEWSPSGACPWAMCSGAWGRAGNTQVACPVFF
jgi:hypothetical protein